MPCSYGTNALLHWLANTKPEGGKKKEASLAPARPNFTRISFLFPQKSNWMGPFLSFTGGHGMIRVVYAFFVLL